MEVWKRNPIVVPSGFLSWALSSVLSSTFIPHLDLQSRFFRHLLRTVRTWRKKRNRNSASPSPNFFYILQIENRKEKITLVLAVPTFFLFQGNEELPFPTKTLMLIEWAWTFPSPFPVLFFSFFVLRKKRGREHLEKERLLYFFHFPLFASRQSSMSSKKRKINLREIKKHSHQDKYLFAKLFSWKLHDNHSRFFLKKRTRHPFPWLFFKHWKPS